MSAQYGTFTNYVGDGATTDFSVPFPYLDAVDVKVKVGGVTTPVTFPNPNVIRFSPAPAVGAAINIARITAISSPRVVYANGSSTTAQQFNTLTTQLLFALQEAADLNTVGLDAANLAQSEIDATVVAAHNAVDTANAAVVTATNAVTTTTTTANTTLTSAQTAAAAAAQSALDAKNAAITIKVSPTPPTVGVGPGALWWKSDTGTLFTYYDDGSSLQWVALGFGGVLPSTNLPLVDGTAAPGTALNYAREDHVHPKDNSLFNTALSLTDTQKAQARSNVYAAPFDALAYNGLQINGSFDVSQELGSNTTSGSFGFVCDGWQVGRIGTMATFAARNASTIPGAAYMLLNGVSTPQATMGATDLSFVYQNIEGCRTARLLWGTAQAMPITIAFWHQHVRPGTYTGAVRNGPADRSYAFTYTQNVGGASEYSTITIPGCPDGVWATDNNASMTLNFCQAAGPGRTAPAANAWYSASYVAAPGQVNAVASTSDFLKITNVLVLPGTEAPSAARSSLIMRPFDPELIACQRHFQKSYDYATALGSITNNGALVGVNGPATNGYAVVGTARFPVRLRAAPTTIRLYSPVTGAVDKIRQMNAGADVPYSLHGLGETGFQAYVANVASNANETLMTHYTVDVRL